MATDFIFNSGPYHWLARGRLCGYMPRMIRFFDMADHDRLPWRFTQRLRSVLARL